MPDVNEWLDGLNLDGLSPEMAVQLDGVIRNIATQLGGDKDVDTFNRPQSLAKTQLSREELEALFASDEFCDKVVTLIPNQMMMGGLKFSPGVESVSGLESEEEIRELLAENRKLAKLSKAVQRIYERSEILKAMREANILSNLHNRGAAVVLDVRDGRRWSEPVDLENTHSVSVAFVADGYALSPTYLGYETEPSYFTAATITSQGLNDIDQREYEPNASDAAAALRRLQRENLERLGNYISEQSLDRIHKDRVLWQEGGYSPWSLRSRCEGSVGRLQKFWPHYSRYVAGLGAASNNLQRMEVMNVRRKGLVQMISTGGQESQNIIQQQMQSLSLLFNNLGIALTDKDQTEIDIIRRSLGGIPQILAEFKKAMIGNAGGIPEIFLFDHPSVGGGMNNDNLRDRMLLANAVHTRQETEHRTHYLKFTRYVLASKKGPLRGEEYDDWTIEFPTTLKLTLTEEIALQERKARVDKMYREMGVSSRSIIMSRWGENGQWQDGLNLLDPVVEFISGKPQPVDPRTEGYLIPGMEGKTSGDMQDLVDNFPDLVDAYEAQQAEEALNEVDLGGFEGEEAPLPAEGEGDVEPAEGEEVEPVEEEGLTDEEIAQLEAEVEAEIQALASN